MQAERSVILGIAAWMFLCLLLVNSLEVFFVLVLLAILVARELTDSYTSKAFKDRMSFFIYTFLFVFSFIVARKVYMILVD